MRTELSDPAVRNARDHWYEIHNIKAMPHPLPGMTDDMIAFFQKQGWDLQRTISQISTNYWFNSYTLPANQVSFFLLKYTR